MILSVVIIFADVLIGHQPATAALRVLFALPDVVSCRTTFRQSSLKDCQVA